MTGYVERVRLAGEYVLIDRVSGIDRQLVNDALAEAREAISRVVWPPGASRFTIYPQSGKRRGEENGVLPIRTAFIVELVRHGWRSEVTFPLATALGGATFGPMDATRSFTGAPPFCLEWETGNISSSHRAMNKMAIGLLHGALLGGLLVVPTRDLVQYLTDRIGNLRELLPYLPLWESVPVERGFLAIFAVEHDDTSFDVPQIPKMTDGRAAN